MHPRLSASCLGLALTLGSLWWSAASTYVVLHDDARLVGALTRTLDQPAVRAQLGEWTGTAFAQASRPAGDRKPSKAADQALRRLQTAITSDAPLEPLAIAMTGVVVGTRDAAVAQLDARAVPKSVVRADVAPLLALAGVTVDEKTAAAMGLTLEKRRLTLPVLTDEQLDLLQHRYDVLLLIRPLGRLGRARPARRVGGDLRRPLRTLAVGAGLVAVIALVLPRLLAYGQGRVAGSELGGAVDPLLAAAAARVAVVGVPVALVAGLLSVVLGALQVLLLRRRSGRARAIESES